MADLTPQGHALGLTLVPPDPRAWPFLASATQPPLDISWRDRMRPVGQQGGIGACTGFGGTAAVEALRQDGVDRAPLFVYYYDRAEDGTAPNQDNGATMVALCKALRDYGAPPESAWPYDPSRFSVRPSADAQAQAAQCKIDAFYQVQGTGAQLLQGMWAAIQRGPFPIALKVFNSYESPDSRGRVPIPTTRESMLGGHCVCVTGWWNDPSAPGGYGWWEQQGSWGEGMGDGGYWLLPAGYVLQNIIVEAHVLTIAAAPQPPEDDVLDPEVYEQLSQAIVEANAITANLDTGRYILRDTDPSAAWTFVGEGSRIQSSQKDRLQKVLELLPPK